MYDDDGAETSSTSHNVTVTYRLCRGLCRNPGPSALVRPWVFLALYALSVGAAAYLAAVLS